MLVSGRIVRNAVVGVAASGAMLIGGASLASADPLPPVPVPSCTAGDLAVASGTVGTAFNSSARRPAHARRDDVVALLGQQGRIQGRLHRLFGGAPGILSLRSRSDAEYRRDGETEHQVDDQRPKYSNSGRIFHRFLLTKRGFPVRI